MRPYLIPRRVNKKVSQIIYLNKFPYIWLRYFNEILRTYKELK